MIDVSHGNVENEQPPFSEEEQEILNLYDQVQTLELEIALTKARVRLSGEPVPSISQTIPHPH